MHFIDVKGLKINLEAISTISEVGPDGDFIATLPENDSDKPKPGSIRIQFGSGASSAVILEGEAAEMFRNYFASNGLATQLSGPPTK